MPSNTFKRLLPLRIHDHETTKVVPTAARSAQDIAVLHPYRCFCALVKSGEIDECPVHELTGRLPEMRH
jgi:hypothetical protein